MPKLRTRLRSETPKRRCSTSGCAQPAIGTRVVRQRIKANGVPPYIGFYPCCADCRQRIERQDAKKKPQAGITVTWRPL